jgi:hypothetical protein
MKASRFWAVAVLAILVGTGVWLYYDHMLETWSRLEPHSPDPVHTHYLKTATSIVYLDDQTAMQNTWLSIAAAVLTVLGVGSAVVAKAIEDEWIST